LARSSICAYCSGVAITDRPPTQTWDSSLRLPPVGIAGQGTYQDHHWRDVAGKMRV
jgi:hypothetical protein